MDSKLTNCIISLISVLQEYYDYHIKYPSRGYWNLVDAGMFSGLFISESITILKNNNLLRDDVPDLSFRPQEPPTVFWRRDWMDDQEVVKYYANLLNETISFRDECRERYLRKLQPAKS